MFTWPYWIPERAETKIQDFKVVLVLRVFSRWKVTLTIMCFISLSWVVFPFFNDFFAHLLIIRCFPFVSQATLSPWLLFHFQTLYQLTGSRRGLRTIQFSSGQNVVLNLTRSSIFHFFISNVKDEMLYCRKFIKHLDLCIIKNFIPKLRKSMMVSWWEFILKLFVLSSRCLTLWICSFLNK